VGEIARIRNDETIDSAQYQSIKNSIKFKFKTL